MPLFLQTESLGVLQQVTGYTNAADAKHMPCACTRACEEVAGLK
jgi:hypothetical protein